MRNMNSNRTHVAVRVAWLTMMALLLSFCFAAAQAQEKDGGGDVNRAPPLMPIVTLTISSTSSPAYTAPATIRVQASAIDQNGLMIFQTDLYKNDVWVTSDGDTLDTTLGPLSAGTYTIRVDAANENGDIGTAEQTITIAAPTNTPPSVSLTAPSNGASYTIGATVALTATASDSDGTISKVEFYVDSTKVGQATSSPYTYNWTATAGDHSVYAKATDNANANTSTSPVTIHGVPPVPTLSLPSSNTTGSYTASWTTSTGATHYELSEQVGSGGWSSVQDAGATSWTASGKANGSYSYKVRACAGSGTGNCSAYSSTKTITVTSPTNIPPDVSLTSPTSGASYTIGTTVALTATASDSDGTVTKVEFHVDGAKVGQATSSPYTYNWTATAGDHSVYAKATDNATASTSTSPITIHGVPPVPTLSLPSSSATGSYTASWTTSTGATHYELSEKVGSGSWTVIQDTSATSRSISGKADGSYSYRVRACTGSTGDTSNCSSYSSTKTITVSIVVTPPASGDFSKTEVISYHDNTTLWVLGQTATVTCLASSPASTACDGDVVSATTFDATTALPLTSSAFGKLQVTATYNSNGTLATFKDGNNRTTTYSSWKRGIPQSIQFADATTRSATVDDNGWITSVTDETGALTCYGYDDMGRISSITYPSEASLGICDTLTWNGTVRQFEQMPSAEYGIGAGHWREKITTGHAIKVTYYDGQWRPRLVHEYDDTAVTDTQRFTATTYDAEGRVTFTSYPSSASAPSTGVHTSYDGLGRPTSVTQDSELGSLTTTTAYGSGFTTTVTDARGNATSTAYQAYDRPTTDWPALVAQPGSVYTHIARDPFGKPTRIRRSDNVSPTGGTVSLNRDYGYNTYQELCRVVEPETGATLMGYDGAGNLKWSASGLVASQACEANGASTAVAARRVDRTYDSRNRISTLAFPDLNGNQTWTYTADGLPDTVTTYNDAGASTVANAYSYNKRRLLIGESQVQTGNPDTWSIGYGYDANAAPASLVYPTGLTVTYLPNALGQPTQVASSTQTFASAISYFPNGALKQFTYGNGIVHTLTQNTRGLPDRSRDMNGSTAIHDDSYDYDQVGNVAAISDAVAGNRGNRDMAYDALNRLTGTTSPMFGTATYTYDVLDNLTHVQVTGGSQARNQDYCYDGANRLTNLKTGGCGGTSVIGLGYDVQGNLANKNGVLYGFDYGNRLRSGDPETYRYDAYGRRVRSINGTGGILYSLYGQAGQLLWQRDQRTSQRRNYVYLQGSLLAEHRRPIGSTTETIVYQHTDALGSPVATTDSAKTVLQRSEYEPYGYLLNRAMEDGPGYTGHATDAATGLVYMQQRYYDPVLGRFLSVDPVTAYSNPIGAFNRYWYASDNPYKFTDPDGRSVLTKLIKLAIKGGDVAATVGGIVDDVNTLRSSTATTGEKVLAGASLLSEVVSPVSIGDAKDVARGVSRLADGVNDARSSQVIYRRGVSSETATRLERKSTEAEGSNIGIHGVSGSAAKPDGPCSGATCGQLEAAGFKVHDTPTRNDPNHKTIEMPKPVTKEDADRFNRTMGRTQ